MTRKIISITALAVARTPEALSAGDPPYEILALLEDGKTVVALVSGDEFELDGEALDDGDAEETEGVPGDDPRDEVFTSGSDLDA